MVTILIIAAATFLATMLGGLVALRMKDKLHLVLGFSAGAVIAVALFDLLPEAIDLGRDYFDVSVITSVAAVGFLIYLVLDRLIFFHTHIIETDDHDSHEHDESKRGILGAGTLSVHSFLDGLAIGLSFQISVSVGLIVAVAVLVHDFSDGINTVGMILKNNGERSKAYKWLFVDALAPVLGVCSTFFFSLPAQSLSIVLALFSGFFIYISASDLIPESHHAHPKFMTTFMTILGAGILYVAIQLVSI
ncbi:MAG: ZIP family metal transporter [Candidatus Taylorbacteria bacterium]